jgi:CHAT domain-containing protein
LVSLWPIGELATSLLLSEFYRGVLNGKLPATALRDAQNYLRSASSAEINSAFHEFKQRLEEANADPAALRPLESALETEVPESVSYDHPYYWAPFILVS